MIIGVPKESYPGERRVALVPAVLPTLTKAGFEVHIQSGAGMEAGYPDSQYADKGAKIVADRAAVFAGADIVVQILCYGSNDVTGKQDVPLFRRDQILIGFLRPFGSADIVQEIAHAGVTAFSVELMPRTTRAQSMDALSSMGTVCGYKAVLVAADSHPRFFPMLTTAAGTITPARVFVIGCGVAGLQAIATARRLGAVISAYDLRPAAKEQVQSLGGRFVELPIEAKDAQDARGYGTAQDEDFYRRQRELLGKVVQESDVVITAAVIPGKKSPVLVTEDMVKGMAPGFGDPRSGLRTWRKLRYHRSGQDRRQAWRDHHRRDQPGHRRALSREHDVCPQHHCIPDASDQRSEVESEPSKMKLSARPCSLSGGEIVNARVREFFKLPALRP